MSNVKKTLQKLEELFVDKTHWTQVELARDANGVYTDPRSEAAVCFCILGGLEHIDPVTYYEAANVLRNTAEKELGTRLLTDVNDEMGYDAVMHLIRLAKEKA